MQEMRVRSLGGEDPLEEEMATHSGILAWRIPRTEEPGGLEPVQSQSQTGLKQVSMQARSTEPIQPGSHLFLGTWWVKWQKLINT